MWLEVIISLKINLEKSKLILVGKIPNAEELVVKMGCGKGELLVVYLGLPLGDYYKLREGWHV